MKLPVKSIQIGLLCTLLLTATEAAIAADSTALNAGKEPQSATKPIADASGRLVEMASAAVLAEDEIGAIRLFHQAMVANPRNIAVYNGLGSLHVAHGRYQLGIKYFDTALKIDQVDLGALEAKAMAQLAAQNISGAHESFAIIQKVCAVRSCDAMSRVQAAIGEFENGADGDPQPDAETDSGTTPN